MAINELGFTKNAALLNAIVSQATGRQYIAPINRDQFVVLGQIGLKAGYEQLLDSISSVMAKTIFSVRPYKQKLKGLRRSAQEWGDMTRKLKMLDSNFTENNQYDLKEGESYDMYKVRKEKVLQMNFYGYQTYSREMMIWANQLNVAFSGPEDFSRFLGMKTQNTIDQIVKGREEFSRQAIANLMGGVYYSATQDSATVYKHPERVVLLITEYNVYAGTNFSARQVLQKDNIVNFAQWFFARFGSIIGKLSERSILFHQNPYEATHPLNQHTQMADLICYMFKPFMDLLDTTVHSEIFHNEYLKFIDYEPVNFWQNIHSNETSSDPEDFLLGFTEAIKGSVNYLTDSGELAKSPDDFELAEIAGVLFDRDAAGLTVFDERQTRTPWNAEGEYAKLYFKYTDRYWNDFTENVVVLLLK